MGRVFTIVLDSVGIGDAPDAEVFGTAGSNTLSHVAKTVGGLNTPVMQKLGLGNVHPLLGVGAVDEPAGCFGAMSELSNAKDSTSGHWELMGVPVEEPFPTYPDGFPDEVISEFEEITGLKVLGNKTASGTKIIEELGIEHIESGNPIIYTSADSVFQIAAHEDVIPVDDLYDICRQARGILTGDHAVGRVIARPFVGKPGSFDRTHKRKDFSLDPFESTALDDLEDSVDFVHGVGKIHEIFNGRGLTDSTKVKDNDSVIQETLSLIKTLDGDGLVFVNLVDFDMRYGHRNDPAGYAEALEEWDKGLGNIIESLRNDDLLIITADHGTDPTTNSTDHSREVVPLLVYGKSYESGIDLGMRIGFSDVGQTILDFFDLPPRFNAESFLPAIT